MSGDRLQAFGLSLELPGEWPPGAWIPRASDAAPVRLEVVERTAVDELWSGFAAFGWDATIEGAPFII